MRNAYLDGQLAFATGKQPLDNPYFAMAEQAAQFDDWSDGWIMMQEMSLPRKLRKYTAKGRWKNSTRGLTSTWSQMGLVDAG